VKKTFSICVILSVCSLGGCGGGAVDPQNILLGKWKLVPDAVHSKYCLAMMEFAATTYIAPNPQGKLSTIPVRYVTGDPKTITFPATVYVLTDAGIEFHTTYVFSNINTMMLNTGAMCSYTRQ
jgi:hypothetical protein